LGLHSFFPDGISVQAESPWKDFQTLVEYAKKNPGKFRIGTLGVGSINHFRLEIIKSLTGTDIAMIPFKGSSPALTALLGGHIEGAFVAFNMVHAHHESGKLRGILADQKVAALPPTYFGFAAPAGIPEEPRRILVPAIEKVWFFPNYRSPAEFKQLVTRDYENACAIVKKMDVSN
jgi:tripartite-type tricarboxylate transporter receptor subunit TctC